MNDIVSTQNFLLCRIKIKTNNCTKRVKILLLTTNLTTILSVPNKLTIKIKIIVNNTKEHQFLVMHLMIQTAKEMKMMKIMKVSQLKIDLNTHLRMVLSTKANGEETRDMVMEFRSGQMEQGMKVIGERTKLMERVSSGM